MSTVSRYALWAMLVLLAAALVVADPMLARLLPVSLWEKIGLARAPIRVVPLIAAVGAAAWGLWWLTRQARDFTTGAIATLLIFSQLNGIGFGPLDLFDVALFGTAALWIVRLGLDERRVVHLSPLFFMAGGLVVLTLAHFTVAVGGPVLGGLVGIIRVALISFLVVDLCRTPRYVEFALKALVAVATASAIFGIVQFALAFTEIYRFTLIDPPSTAFKPTPIGFVMRSSALCTTAQHFSSFLVYALPAALWQMTERPRWRDLLVVLTILAGIGASLNFGALFGAMLVLVIFPILRWPRLIIHFTVATLAVLSLFWYIGVLHWIYDVSFGDAGIAKGLSQRKTLFELGLREIGQNPLVGTGFGNFTTVSGNFWHRPVHNIFGQAASELGIFGALILICAFFYLTLGLLPMLSYRSRHLKHAALAFIMVITALLIGQTEPNVDQSNFWMVMSLAQAVVLFAPRRRMPLTAAEP